MNNNRNPLLIGNSLLNEEKDDTASMRSVTMEKAKLLEILKDNKQRHDGILEVARNGYLEAAKKVLAEKKKLFFKYLKEQRRDFKYSISKLDKKIGSGEQLEDNCHITIKAVFNTKLDLQYPEDHSKDYDRAIKMVELSVFDKVTLSVQEFECYVLNNWEWSDSFINLNSTYASLSNIRGGYSNSYANDVSTGKEIMSKVLRRA